jgi:hypothetical protein
MSNLYSKWIKGGKMVIFLTRWLGLGTYTKTEVSYTKKF